MEESCAGGEEHGEEYGEEDKCCAEVGFNEDEAHRDECDEEGDHEACE